MIEYEIVYIKGNANSGSKILHESINKSIYEFIKEYKYKIIESDYSNKEALSIIPKALIYIGFSRGTRYLKKLPSSSLKISIGGVRSSGVYQFLNKKDKVQEGDLGSDSLESHFIIEEEHKIEINKLIRELLKNNE